jgi:hypothetical protein
MAKELEAEKTSRRKQFVQTYRMAKKTDRTIGLWILGSFVLGAVLGFAIIWLLPGDGTLSLILSIIGALLVGLLLALVVFGRRAQKAAYGQMKGQVGAAASALTMLRRGWKTDPVVGFNRQQDVVHRVVGPPGVVLVGEGNPQRLRALMNVEHRKHARVLPDTPIHEVVCGDGEGEVPLDKLVRHVSKLPKSLKGGDMTDVLNRLKAIDAQRGTLPLPKGPVPSSMKGMRGQQRGR